MSLGHLFFTHKNRCFFVTTLFVTLFPVSIFGQKKEEEKQPFFLNEFSISVNRTNLTYSGFENRFGGGAGVYHSAALSKQWNYVFGLEYNYTSCFVDYISHYPSTRDHAEDVTFHVHTVSMMPIAFRFSLGNNVKYFLESGFFLGVANTVKNGTLFLGYPTTPPQATENQASNSADNMKNDMWLSSGASFGIGMRIPMKGIEWIVKADYRVGLERIDGYLFYQYYRLGVGIRKRT